MENVRRQELLMMGIDNGHRKQQLSYTENQQNTVSFSNFIDARLTYNKAMVRLHRCSTYSWAAAVTPASGQRTSIVLSYQNDASPQPRMTASHCGPDSVYPMKRSKRNPIVPSASPRTWSTRLYSEGPWYSTSVQFTKNLQQATYELGGTPFRQRVWNAPGPTIDQGIPRAP